MQRCEYLDRTCEMQREQHNLAFYAKNGIKVYIACYNHSVFLYLPVFSSLIGIS